MNPQSRAGEDTVRSPSMQNVLKTIHRVAMSDLGVLVIGEFGSGKEWLARRIHQLSLHSRKKFLSIDCTMLAPDRREVEIFGQEQYPDQLTVEERGFLEDANAGTLFLGGFASLPADVQMRLTRAVEHQKFRRIGGNKDIWFNARIILSATKKPDLSTPEGVFQKDIYYRLTPIVVDLPPLRARKEDILPLAERFVMMSNDRNGTRVPGVSRETSEIFLKYAWPGNIRELRNTIEYSVIMAQDKYIHSTHLPLQIRGGKLSKADHITIRTNMSVSRMEKLLIEHALLHSASKKEAARHLGISVKTLYNKLSRYHLNDQPQAEAKNKMEGFEGETEDEHHVVRSIDSSFKH